MGPDWNRSQLNRTRSASVYTGPFSPEQIQTDPKLDLQKSRSSFGSPPSSGLDHHAQMAAQSPTGSLQDRATPPYHDHLSHKIGGSTKWLPEMKSNGKISKVAKFQTAVG